MKKPHAAIMTITPQQAANWLEHNHDRNRRIRESRVRQYVADMESGRWVLCDQAISFDIDKNLINGQHRLTACVKCERSFESLVLFNMPRRAMMVIDGSMKRNTDDAFTLTGREFVRGCGATVRRLYIGMKPRPGRSVSDQEVEEFMENHGKSVELAHRVLPKQPATVRSVAVRAHIMRAPVKRIEEFGKAMTDGMMESPKDGAAIQLRNWMLRVKNDGGSERAKVYSMAQTALKAFLSGETPTKLKPAKEELFPLPGESGWFSDDIVLLDGEKAAA